MAKEDPQPVDTPPVLYKYRPFDANGFDINLITQGRVWFSSARHFNDPFDSSVHLFIDSVPWETQLRHAMGLLRRTNPTLNREQRRVIATRQLKERERDPNRSQQFQQSQQRQNETAFGICCLTPVYDDLLMWAHYSDNHTGFCIGFHSHVIERWQQEFVVTNQSLLDLVKIEYSEEMPRLGFYETMLSDDWQDGLMKLVTTRSIYWSYEQEYRLMYWDHPDTALALGREVVAEVIFGCRADDSDITGVFSALGSGGVTVPLYKARKHSTKFALEFDRIN